MRLIDADELKAYEICGSDEVCGCCGFLPEDIADAQTVNAIPIPDCATNGDMIMAMFPNAKANVFVKEVGVKGLDTFSTFTKKWWNSPYEVPKGDKND